MLLAEGGQVVGRQLVFLGQLGYGEVGHHDVPQQFFLLLLNHPLLGRGAECLVKLPLESRGRHVQQFHQFLGRLHLGVELHHPVLEVAEGYSNSERVKVIFTDALPSVIFVSYAGEPDVNDFMVDGHLVQATDGGLVIGAEFDAIYLDPAGGSDDNSGTSRDQAVKTLDKAKELAGDMPVVVCGTIEVGKDADFIMFG